MELEIKEYMKIIKKRLWIIMSLVLITTLITGIISYKYIQPVYEANVKLIVTKAQESLGEQVLDFGSINANIKLVTTYKEIIKTPAIMDKVAEQYPNLGVNSSQLIAMVNVSSANDSQVMSISVQDNSYNRAARIVNAIAAVFLNKIPTIMKVDNVTILNQANETIKPAPIKPNPKVNIVISFILSLMIALGFALFLEYLDDSIKTEQEIKNYFGISTLCVISKIKSKEMKQNVVNQTPRSVGEPVYASANQ